jgi:hypothetical protein
MSFKNLEQRYNENIDKLYAGAKYKFDGGRASTGANDDPLMVRKPGDGRLGIKQEGRSLPFNSAPRDVIRLTLFTASLRGILHLAKQQLLQTGNTFEQTRLINPVFAIGNAIPFLHLRRHVRPLSTLFTRTDRHYSNVRKLGQLQKSTYNSFTENSTSGVKAFLKKLAGPITSTISAFTAKKNVGEEFGYDEAGWKKSRPELGQTDKDYIVGFNAPNYLFGGTIKTENFNGVRFGAIPSSPGNWDGTYTTYLSDVLSSNGEKIPAISRLSIDYKKDFVKALPLIAPGNLIQDAPEDLRSQLISDEAGPVLENNYKSSDVPSQLSEQLLTYQEITDTFIQSLTEQKEALNAQPFLYYFDHDDEAIFSPSQNAEGTINARNLARTAREEGRRISYIRDPSNVAAVAEGNVLSRYKNLRTVENDPFDDAITVSFAMGQGDHVQFRAYIRDLTQSASPEYKTQQYIGRIEKFVSYITVQREVSFKLDILAYSKDELEIVWNRINYLTSFVYPHHIYKGILQPNIIRMTIGNVYVDQPAYVTSMNTNFNEISESWDLDREVPIGASMDMSFVLIEKDTKTAGKPFYGITEGRRIAEVTIGEVQPLPENT